MEKKSFGFLKLNFTPNTMACYVWVKQIFLKIYYFFFNLEGLMKWAA